MVAVKVTPSKSTKTWAEYHLPPEVTLKTSEHDHFNGPGAGWVQAVPEEASFG